MKELVRLSLNQPVKLFVDSNTDTAYNLQQEFVRIRTKHEADREAIVAGTVRTIHTSTILWYYFITQYCVLVRFMITAYCS